MRVFKGFDSLSKFRDAVVTLGSFDGLHRGHISLLETMCRESEQSGGESVVLTFGTHPRVVLGQADGLRLLSSLEEKIALLEGLGIDNLVVIPFDREFSRLSHKQFVKQYLVDMVGVSRLVVGYNHHFGRGNEGSYSEIVKMGDEYGFKVHRVEEWREEGVVEMSVSSTVLRRLVANGDVERAAELLSRPYMVIGQADGDGRVWLSEPLKLLPATGCYMAKVNGDECEVKINDNGVLSVEEMGESVYVEFLSRL